MELTGFKADAEALRELSVQYAARLNSLSARIFELAGESFNINSTKQLGSVLFEKLGLPHGRKTKTGYSTDIDVLENLREQHEIIPLIMEYRQIQKIKSTYTDGLLALIQPGGRIHTTFKQTVTATGRISSAGPISGVFPCARTRENIRRAFIPAEGCVLLDGDYSQMGNCACLPIFRETSTLFRPLMRMRTFIPARPPGCLTCRPTRWTRRCAGQLRRLISA